MYGGKYLGEAFIWIFLSWSYIKLLRKVDVILFFQKNLAGREEQDRASE